MADENHCPLVEHRVRLSINSSKALSGYRTERPILTYRGPVPESLDLASQETDTFSILAASLGCRRGSTVLGFAGPVDFTWRSSLAGVVTTLAALAANTAPVRVLLM